MLFPFPKYSQLLKCMLIQEFLVSTFFRPPVFILCVLLCLISTSVADVLGGKEVPEKPGDVCCESGLWTCSYWAQEWALQGSGKFPAFSYHAKAPEHLAPRISGSLWCFFCIKNLGSGRLGTNLPHFCWIVQSSLMQVCNRTKSVY